MNIEKQNFPEFCYNLQIKKMEIFMEDALFARILLEIAKIIIF